VFHLCKSLLIWEATLLLEQTCAIMTVGKSTCSEEYFISYISKFHCWFLQIFSLSDEQAWSRFDKYLAYAAKSCHDDSWKGRTFWNQYALLAEWKRIFLFLKHCTVQFKDSVSFWGPKAFSFGRCDHELRTKCRKMVKMKVLRTDWNLNNWIELVFLISAL